MREAIYNRDFSFRISTKGLPFGERALQEALNDNCRHIQTLVAQNEMESWQRLTRVLTHEIMNAATPISTITQAYLSDPAIKGSPYEEGIRAIHATTTGMTEFVRNFRKMNDLQEPTITDIPLRDMLLSLKSMHPDIHWLLEVDDEVRIKADENMLRQVLTNLIKNAKEAGATKIEFKWEQQTHVSSYDPLAQQKFALYISNNGKSIPAEEAKEIFTPFFTTKSTGTGIGLPLARQMMMKQGINLLLSDRALPGYHVTFLLCN
jgi:nitrogen fixation/metabolism regulation signal transduction histidine kinase